MVAVSSLVAQRHLGGTADGAARGRALVIDTHLARAASNGGATFHDRGGPYGGTKGAKRFVAVDVTGLPVGALVVPAATHENRASELMLEHLSEHGVNGRLELVFVTRPLPPWTFSQAGEVVRGHHYLSHGVAPSRLHREHPAPPVADATCPTDARHRCVSAVGP